MNLQQTISKITGESSWLSQKQQEQKAVEILLNQESRIKELEEQLNKTSFDLQCQATENQQYREVLEDIKEFSKVKNNLFTYSNTNVSSFLYAF